MPRVLPRASCEPLAVLSHSPRWAAALRAGMPRRSITTSASTSSATLRVLENGALKTGMPRSRAAPTSTWSVPMQKAPTAMSFLASPSTRAVSRVRERMPTRCASRSFSIRASSSSAPGTSSTDS